MIVITSGYFDPLHRGHIEGLEAMKYRPWPDDMPTTLIVIVNNDRQAALKKGRSFMPLEDRMIIMRSLRVVDAVWASIDEDLTVCATLHFLHARYRDREWYNKQVFAKGGDRTDENTPEYAVCRELGIQFQDGFGKKVASSSKFLEDWGSWWEGFPIR